MYNQRWVIMFVLQKALHSPPGTLSAHSMLHNTGGRSGESLVTSQKERARERERAFACLPIVKNVVFMCLPVHFAFVKEINSNKQLITGCFLLTHTEGMFKTCSL